MNPTLLRLETAIAGYESGLVAFSGGVDSALVAVVAARVLGKDRCTVGIGISPSLARNQLEQARSMAATFSFDLLEVKTSEVDDPSYAANPTNRCYFCKHELWDRFTDIARTSGLRVVMDGTNADDLGEHRPGRVAGGEYEIRSPLAEVGFTKADVRSLARSLDIEIWDAPSAPCLASRIKYGVSVNPERLAQVEQGEELLRSLGVAGDFRVRHLGSGARLEVMPDQFAVVRENADQISDGFRSIGFDGVALDLKGYRRGSQLEAQDPPVEVLSPGAGAGAGAGVA